jgi:DNA polymerase-1
MLAAQIVECGMDAPKGHFTLEQCVARYVRPYYTNQGNLFAPTVTKKIRASFAEVKDEPYTWEQIYYGAFDIETAYVLHEKLLHVGKENDLLNTFKLEFEFLKVLGDMELNGVYLDSEKWLHTAREVEIKALQLRNQLNELSPINWDSPKQAVGYLKGVGVDVLILDKKTGEIKESVGKIGLQKQAARFPVLDTYLTYKTTKKKAVAYGEKFLRHINPHTGRVHSSFMQIMRTGRTSSTNPNIQNITRGDVYRSAFMAEEGNTLVVADFSNQEMRVIADKSGDPNLIAAFKANRDIHLETAKLTFDNPDLDKESDERQMAKSINFLAAFGGGAKKLSENFGILMAKAKAILKAYFIAFPALNEYFRTQGVLAKERGYILCNPVSGRRSYIPFYEKYLTFKHYMDVTKAHRREPHPVVADQFSY